MKDEVLTEKQLQWCRDHILFFKEMEERKFKPLIRNAQ